MSSKLSTLKDKRGNVLVYVLVLAIAVTSTIAGLLAVSRQNYNGAVVNQLNTKAYYLTMETADIVLAALLQGDGDDRLIEIVKPTGTPLTDAIDYGDDGKSYVKVIAEHDDSIDSDWLYVYITTVVPDFRVNIGDTSGASKTYELYYQLKMLKENTDVRAFDMLIEDKAR